MDLEWTKQTQISLTWTKIVHKQQKQALQNRNKIRFQDVIKVVDKLHKSHIQKPFIQIYYHSVSKLLKMHVWALYSQSSKSRCLKIAQNVACEFWHFCPIKTDLSGNTV